MITFDLPRSFDPTAFLPPRLQIHADGARWLVSTILRKTANRDTDAWGCVRLDSRILQRIMGREHSNHIVRALEQGAIETAPHAAGVKCKGYRLARRYLADRCVRRPAVDRRLIERIEREHRHLDAEQRQARWLPIHHRLDAEQRRLSITAAADAILDDLPDHTRLCQNVLVQRLRHREFPFSVSTTGRAFNSVTGLKRELRTALRIGGEPIGGVDIACAQPALLALAMAQNLPTNGVNELLTYKHTPCSPASYSPASPAPDSPSPDSYSPASYSDLVEHGAFYEHLVAVTGLSRDAVKLSFLRDVLAKRGRYPSAVEQAFRLSFPAVHSFIRNVNHNDHGELIRYLQRLESRLVIETVAPRLVDRRVPCLTLHDAIFSTVSFLPAVETAFAEVFDSLGFRLSLKTELA